MIQVSFFWVVVCLRHAISPKIKQKNPRKPTIITKLYIYIYFKDKISCVGNRNLFYFDENGIFLKNQRLPVQNDFNSVLFVECNVMVWNIRHENRLFVSIFIQPPGVAIRPKRYCVYACVWF